MKLSSIRIKISVITFILIAIIMITLGIINRIIVKNTLEDTGLEQIVDTLEGGYSLVSYYYEEVEKGKITKEKAFSEIKRILGGPINKLIIAKNNLEEFLNTIGIKKEINSEKENITIEDKEVIDSFINYYEQLTIEAQYELVNKFGIKIIRDFSKSTIRIRKSSYVWAITGNPANSSEGKAFEAFHPSLEGVNVWNAKNYLGERVGKNISDMNGKIDSVKEGETVRYDYWWKNPTDPEPRKKIVLMKYFKPWNLVIASGLYEDEFFGVLDILKTTTLIIIVISSLLTFYLIYIFISKIVVSPLKKLEKQFDELSKGEGDLTKKINILRKDEIGDISLKFNTFTETLKNMIEKLKKMALSLSTISSELASNSEETSAVVREVTASNDSVIKTIGAQNNTINQIINEISIIINGINTISKSVDETMIEVDSSSSAIEEMSSNINSIGDMTKKADSLTIDLKEITTKSNTYIENLVKSIDVVAENSEKIFDMVQLIMDISEQTNLLAMNAAIEAAHTGEYGKGFAVVAEEIRKLADKSAQGAKEIQLVVKEISNNIQENKKFAAESITSFKSIINSVEKVKTVNHEISSSMEEQRNANKSILQSITKLKSSGLKIKEKTEEEIKKSENIKNYITKLTSLIQEIELSTKEQNIAMEEALRAVENLRNMTIKIKEYSKEIKENSDRFKTE